MGNVKKATDNIRQNAKGRIIWQTYHRLTYSMLDAVPPIHAESSHVATDMDPSK